MNTSSPAPTEDAARLAVKQLWHKLGPGPWETPDEYNVATDAMLAAIIAAAGIYEGDFAGASYRLSLLVSVGALSGVRHGSRAITWTKAATFPEPPEDSLSWVDRENAKLRREHEWEVAEMLREGDARVRAAEVIGAPEQAGFVRRLWKAGVTPDQIRSIVREEVEAALERRQMAATNHDNGLEPEE